MLDDNRITRNQFNILLVTSIITIILALFLGITIGKNMNLPQRFPRADAIAGSNRSGGASTEVMKEIANLPSGQEKSSKKPHVENEGYLYNDLLNDTDSEESDTTTITKPFILMQTPTEGGTTETERRVAGATDSDSSAPAPDAFFTAKPDFTVAYSVQMSSLSDKSSADKTARKFEENGYPAYVSRVQYKTGRTLYRVRIGPYSSREVADEMMSKLKEETKTSPLVMTLKDGDL